MLFVSIAVILYFVHNLITFLLSHVQIVLFFLALFGLYRLFNRENPSGNRTSSRKTLKGMKDLPKDPPKGG